MNYELFSIFAQKFSNKTVAISKNQIKFIRQLEQKKFRRREGLFVAEGTKVVGDLLAHYQPHSLFATPDWLASNSVPELLRSAVPEPVEGQDGPIVTEVSPEELSRISFQQHPQQVLALFPIPSHPFTLSPLHLSLALDGIQDPGNLGTIIRIADWFGIQTIFCSEDTVDAWNPKVVQATMGSIARVNIIYTSLVELIDTLPDDYPVYGTLLDGDNIYTQPLTPHGLIVMGNEGNGISPEIRQKVNRRLLIPSYRNDDTAESLNVAIATAITCAEFRRR